MYCFTSEWTEPHKGGVSRTQHRNIDIATLKGEGTWNFSEPIVPSGDWTRTTSSSYNTVIYECAASLSMSGIVVDCCIRFTQKINMAVTKSDLDPKVCASCELSMRACNWNVTDSKKTIFDVIIWEQGLDMTVQKNVPRFCTGSICGWNHSYWGYVRYMYIGLYVYQCADPFSPKSPPPPL